MDLPLFVLRGPLYLGYLTEDQFGAVFLWGTVINGIYLLPDMQIFFCNWQVSVY